MKAIICVATLLVYGCTGYKEEDFDFNAEELRMLKIFNVGDTTYYVSSDGDIDTTVVLNIEHEQKRDRGCTNLWYFRRP